MGWATPYITQLQSGKQAVFRPKGHSMRPRIKSGQQVTVAPFGPGESPQVGDVVLARVRGAEYLHLVKALRDDQVLIGNAHGHDNGWTSRDRVYGKLVDVRD